MKSDFSVRNNVVNVYCSYLCIVFPYTGNVKYPHGRTYQRLKSKRRKFASGKDCVISQNDRLPLLSLFFSLEATRGFYSVMNDSWSALAWKYDPAQMIRTFLKTPVVFSGFSRRVAMIFPEVRPTFSTKSGNLFEANLTKRGWVSLMGFFLGFLTTLLLRISV